MITDHNLVPNQEARLGTIHQRKIQAIVRWERYLHCCRLACTTAAWTAEYLTSYITQINKKCLLVEDIKVAHPGKVGKGHKWMTWDVKWENYIGPMVGVSGIPLDYGTCCNIPSGWIAANENKYLKYQAIHIGMAWEYDKMTVYTKLKAYGLDGKGCLWIKAYDGEKDGRHDTANLREHYEGDSEVNKHFAWATVKIFNTHFTSDHTYSFDKFSTKSQNDFTFIKKNDNNHS